MESEVDDAVVYVSGVAARAANAYAVPLAM